MTVEELEKEGQIRRIPIDARSVQKALEIAHRDVESAKYMLGNDPDWAYSIAYNATQQSLRALMYSRGYRPSSDRHHAAAIQFAESFFEGGIILRIDKMRRKRAISTYDQAGVVSDQEAKNAVAIAGLVLKMVEERIAER